MTARRLARASAPPAVVDGLGVPRELLDPGHPLWHDRALFVAYTAEQGWAVPAGDRMGPGASPGNRRRAAAAGWARGHGVTAGGEPGGHPDWHRLRALGLID